MRGRDLPGLLLGIVFVALGLVGCDIQRPGGGDIAQTVPEVIASPTGQEGFTPPEAAQTTEAIIRVQPASQQLNVGAAATIQIWISNVTNLTGVDVELRFNPAVLQVQDADPAAEGIQIQHGDFVKPDFVATNNADNVAGVIRYIISQVGTTPPANGEGLLASIPFQAANAGVSDLTFTINKLANNTGVAIPVLPESGQVTVVGAGQPTVEPTAGPTIEPTLAPTIEPTLVITLTPIVPTPVLTETPPAPPTPIPTLAPTLPPPPTATPIPLAEIPPGATFGFCYRVQPGEENIHFLAQKFATTPYAINLVNDLYPLNYIFTHQILFMPTELGHGPNVYIIEQGDSLTTIAAECHLTPAMLIRRNRLDPETNPNAPLPAGQGLIIPIPYFPPPSRFGYPIGPIPIVPIPPPCCRPWPPHHPGP
jgi:hypothetical protein